jgi:hypothetical protein
LFSLLGYNSSPRFRELADQRFWWTEMPGVATGGYGPLEPLACNKVNLNKVTHWPVMLRVAGSLVTGQVRAYELLRMFGREGRPTPLSTAFAEYGRIAKTLTPGAGGRPGRRHLPAADEPAAHRAGVRHMLARDICHGKRGQIMQAYRGRRTSSARSAWSSTPPCCGPPAIWTPPSSSCGRCPPKHASTTSCTRPHRALQLLPPRSDHPTADVTHKRIRLRPVLGGLINEYERAA